MPNPIQPLEKDEHGIIRFKENKIVNYLRQNGGIDLNQLSLLEFSNDDREQFAQLIGYSHSGFGGLDYVSDETYETAEAMYKNGENEEQSRIRVLTKKLSIIRNHIKKIVPQVFRIHPDDLIE